MQKSVSSQPGSQGSDTQTQVVADAHVHIYPCFDLSRFFGFAWGNLASQAREDRFEAVLLLSETVNDHAFRRLTDLAERKKCIESEGTRWTVRQTGEAESLRVKRPDGAVLVVIAGRQIATSEGLEVLALGTGEVFPDGLPLAQVVDQARKVGALPVIPWGFGKWWGRRGAILNRYLGTTRDHEIFLGDNGGRPAWWREPSQFVLARRSGIPILRGSDPLPMPSEAWRPGSYGFRFDASMEPDFPCRSLKAAVRARGFSPLPSGRGEKPHRFVRNQLRMQILKRRRRS